MDYSSVGKENSHDGLFKWFGVDFNYHLIAVVFNDKQPSVLSTTEQGLLTLTMSNSLNNLEYYIIFSKKNYDTLDSLGDNLKQSVDFGVFSILAVPILRGLQFIYKYIPNYGLGIIILTLLIRLLTFPLQYKSFKSMKKMQQVQPELTKLKEKFKDDPQRMQKETMELFKRAGANPLGGCLPLLLQLPFFFAIYKVLYSSVELVGAPFFGWIHDLSNKDPYYVFPVLMAISMFLQQKITPTTTTDATQQKVMMFMPLIFGLIMKDLPSGLVLYIFVSTIFGIAQQFFVYKVTD
jgi:YidC/Oxa1 family membrane protein insertase